MRFEARLTGEAAALARAHQEVLERLPATFHASVLVELEKWPLLFVAEQVYQRTLLQHLASLPPGERSSLFGGIARVESQSGCDRIRNAAPAGFQDEAQGVLRKRRMLAAWRQEVDAVFQRLQPALDATLHPRDTPRRLVVQVYGSGISIQADKLWTRFREIGVRVPLELGTARGTERFLSELLSGHAEKGSSPTLFETAHDSAGLTALDAWMIESGDALQACCDAANASRLSHTALSYERLRSYRDQLTRALYSKVQAGVASPQEFAAYARSLRLAPEASALRNPAEVLVAFVRDVFLTGNGTLFVNNTFVEWAAVQALRRAQPRVLLARYGVRDKMKPFSSLLLFSQPRASDQIPLIEDPVGSFVDVEQLSYYVWLNAEKSSAYRARTLYLFLAEGVDQMLAIPPNASGTARSRLPAATLADVHATMAGWLGVPAKAGRPGSPLSLVTG